jgi:HSP20 family protein
MLIRRVWPSRPTFDGPFADFEQLRRDMRRLLERTGGDGYFGETEAGVFPPINVTQDNDNFYVRAEIPGADPKALSLSALRTRLSISGKREIKREHERTSYHRQERAEGSFNRTVALPTEVDSERVDARYTDGILTVTLPKAEAAKPRQITVRT